MSYAVGELALELWTRFPPKLTSRFLQLRSRAVSSPGATVWPWDFSMSIDLSSLGPQLGARQFITSVVQWLPSFFPFFFPTRQEGVVRFYVGIRYNTPPPSIPPARAARQWVPPSIPPERLASGSRRVSRQSGSPLKIPLSILPERLARASRRVSRQSGSPVDPAEYPARAARH